MLPSFARETIVVLDPVWTTDARGIRRPDYGAAAGRVTVRGCSVQPGASPEVIEAGRASATVRWTVLAPPSAPVSATSAVEYRGKRYAVDGEPQEWPSPTGRLDHKSILLIDWK